MSYTFTDEERAICKAAADKAPPLTREQIDRISLITGLVPLDRNAADS